MTSFPRLYNRISRRSGSSAMEYAFLMGLIAAVSLASFSMFGQKVAGAFFNAQANLASLTAPPTNTQNSAPIDP